MLLVFATLGNAYAEAVKKTVTLATLTDFPPYCFRKEGGELIIGEVIPPGSDSSQLQGYSWDVVRESFHGQGYTIVLHVVPWARGIHYLNSDRVDAIFPANRTKKREELYMFSSKYVDRTDMVVYVPADSDLEWHGLDSLKGLNVGAVREWAYGKKWEENTTIKKEFMDSIVQSFRVMDKGRLDAVIGYEIAYDYTLREKGMLAKYKKIGSFDALDEFVMGKKDNPVVKQLIADFDQGRQLLEETGELAAISRKWQQGR